ncbi:hypothetical protein EB796_003418 [Bugula neritina]|uniref:Apple domain-containing protein n=1 Tax=Bugula neritina TaxID=10212 RepID=A0A7J7KJ58_BUGNE|nr:hypothetical protein EB796_003418 [Bugula neritina]
MDWRLLAALAAAITVSTLDPDQYQSLFVPQSAKVNKWEMSLLSEKEQSELSHLSCLLENPRRPGDFLVCTNSHSVMRLPSGSGIAEPYLGQVGKYGFADATASKAKFGQKLSLLYSLERNTLIISDKSNRCLRELNGQDVVARFAGQCSNQDENQDGNRLSEAKFSFIASAVAIPGAILLLEKETKMLKLISLVTDNVETIANFSEIVPEMPRDMSALPGTTLRLLITTDRTLLFLTNTSNGFELYDKVSVPCASKVAPLLSTNQIIAICPTDSLLVFIDSSTGISFNLCEYSLDAAASAVNCIFPEKFSDNMAAVAVVNKVIYVPQYANGVIYVTSLQLNCTAFEWQEWSPCYSGHYGQMRYRQKPVACNHVAELQDCSVDKNRGLRFVLENRCGEATVILVRNRVECAMTCYDKIQCAGFLFNNESSECSMFAGGTGVDNCFMKTF